MAESAMSPAFYEAGLFLSTPWPCSIVMPGKRTIQVMIPHSSFASRSDLSENDFLRVKPFFGFGSMPFSESRFR
jgi:hypothetical protein